MFVLQLISKFTFKVRRLGTEALAAKGRYSFSSLSCPAKQKALFSRFIVPKLFCFLNVGSMALLGVMQGVFMGLNPLVYAK